MPSSRVVIAPRGHPPNLVSLAPLNIPRFKVSAALAVICRLVHSGTILTNRSSVRSPGTPIPDHPGILALL